MVELKECFCWNESKHTIKGSGILIFGEKMDKKVKVVIIDSGLYMEHPQVNNVVEGYRVCTCKNKIVIDNNCRDGFGHGTAVYGIIRNYCKEAKIVPVKIFEDDEDKADVNILIAALEYIYENISCDIINMSIGVSILKEKEQLYAICDKLVKKGIAIIAAYDNYGSISYPAEFDCVIGVSESVECRKKSSFIYVEGSTKINVLANGNIQRCLWTKPTYQMCGGNSFACAHVTGILCSNYECIQNNYNGNILEYLKDNCIKTLKLNTVSNIKRNDFIYRGKKAVIYPFNKENHNLIRYINMLDFEIIDVFDSKYSGKIGAYTNDLLRTNLSKNFKIKNIDYIDYNMFDLFIVGHTKKLGYAINNNEFTKNIIEECLNP